MPYIAPPVWGLVLFAFARLALTPSLTTSHGDTSPPIAGVPHHEYHQHNLAPILLWLSTYRGQSRSAISQFLPPQRPCGKRKLRQQHVAAANLMAGRCPLRVRPLSGSSLVWAWGRPLPRIATTIVANGTQEARYFMSKFDFTFRRHHFPKSKAQISFSTQHVLN